ncbi:MAG: beta-ketoacyl-[acyl-carrier-protein] synthase II, partial [Sandaracinaceae bacterium]|nr:beta-ketoacyl-[acyl-carrier-protein] synthase II [Sandaracinaceae bacterium]
GGLEAALSVMAMHTGVIPPTINLDNPDEEAAGMDLVPFTARERKLDVVISNSFGFGGTNVTLALGRP